MTIKVYLSPDCKEPVETNEWEGTFLSFCDANNLRYTLVELPKAYITVNGLPVSIHDWDKRVFKSTDDVKITGIPNGGIFEGLGSILGGLLGFVFGFLMPSHKAGGSYRAPQQGQKLETASGKANVAKLNDVVPECAGTFIRYPDYLTEPRRYFVNRRAQMLEFHACIGVGHYHIDRETVKIADTPFDSFGDDAKFQIFDPDVDLSGVSTHENWYTAPEVGGTSSGTAGLELSTEIANRENSQPASYDFDGLSVSRSEGEFPSGWGSGTTVRVSLPLSYTVGRVTEGFEPSITYNTFTGYFDHVTFGVQNTSSFSGWSLETVSGSGNFRVVRLYRMVGDPASKQYYNGSPVGSSVIAFGNLIDREITQYSETDISFGSLPFPEITSTSSVVSFQGGVVYGEWTNEIVVAPASELTSTIELDYFFPTGLCFVDNEGRVQNRTVSVEFQYRDVRGGARTTVRRTYTDRTLDQIGFTERLNIPEMRPAIRTRRVGAASTSTQVKDVVQWYGLKCRLPTVTRYPRWTTMSVVLRSGGRLGAQSENQINLVTNRKLNVLLPDGTWSPDLRPTKDISAWIWYIARSIGYTEESIDMDELRRLHDVWTARGETYSYIVDLTTVKEAMNAAFGAGMANLTVTNGEIRPIREGIRTAFEQQFAYSPQNMRSQLRREFKAIDHDENDGVELEYFDAETYESKTIICKLPESQGIKLRKVKVEWAASRVMAWRYGMRIARAMKYKRWNYSFDTEMDALNSSFGGYVALFDDLIENGQTAQLRSITPYVGGASLVVTERLQWEDGERYVIGYRRKDGSLAGPWEATKGDTPYTAIANIPEPWPEISLKMELPYIYFGKADNFSFPALITDVKPSGTSRVSVRAENYDPLIYADDDNFPPDE